MIAYEPESFLDYLEERVRWTRKLMEGWDYGPAGEKARNRLLAEISLSTLHLILQEALARGEVPDSIKGPLQIKLKSAQENGFANLRETNSNLIDMSVWLRDRSFIAPPDG